MSTKIKFQHEAEVKEETYKLGDWFSTPYGLLQLVGRANSEIALLQVVETGLFWNAGSKVDNRSAITKYEFAIIRGSLDVFTRVSVEITTKPYEK